MNAGALIGLFLVYQTGRRYEQDVLCWEQYNWRNVNHTCYYIWGSCNPKPLHIGCIACIACQLLQLLLLLLHFEETSSFYHALLGHGSLEFRARVWKCSYDEFIFLQFTSISRRSSDCPHVSKSSRAWHQKLSSWSSIMPSAGVWLAYLQE